MNAGRLPAPEPEAEPSRLSDAVYERLLESILDGKLTPGTVLSEVALAKEMAVSRTPVHDALRQLAKDGLIHQEVNRRATVVTVSKEDVYDIFEMRKILESEAAKRAADRIDRPTLARLRGIAETLAATRDRPDWLARWADFDEEFHATIARASGSPRLAADIGRYCLLHRFFNRKVTEVQVLQPALEEHLAILDALEAHDAEAARQAMFDHIREWQAYFVNHFSAAR